MSEQYVIGVDVGTQGTKTALFSLPGDKVAESFEPSRLIRPEMGTVYQEPAEIYRSVTRTIAKTMQLSGVDGRDVLAIGIDGQMAGVLGIDEDWNAITYYDSWLDTRCESYIKHIKQTAEDRVIELTGCPVTYAHGPKILWWKHEKPEIYQRVAKFIMPSVYVTGRLAGLTAQDAFIDYTYLHFTGFADTEKQRWSRELLDLFSVSEDALPKILNPWDIVGRLTAQGADDCGLPEGIPLVAGCGDSAATSLAAGITQPGMAFDVSGTASIFSCCVDRYSPDTKHKTLLYARSVIPGLWIPMAYINGGGMCLEWFRDNMAPGISFRDLDMEADGLPAGSGDLMFLPHFSGRTCPSNPYIRGSWIGLQWNHGRGHLFRSIMEGIGYEYKHYITIIQSLLEDIRFKEVCVIGGGAKSRVFNQIKADVLGVDYKTLTLADTAALGSAVIAGYGVGAYRDLKQAVDGMTKTNAIVKHDPHRHSVYAAKQAAYEAALTASEMVTKAFE